MLVQYSKTTNKLTGKSKNGDAVKVEELINESIYMFLVADGVGGCVGDYKASKTVVDEFCKNFRENENKNNIKNRISNAIEITNQTILNEIGFYKGMKSTLVLAILNTKSKKVYFVGIGDSRIYNVTSNNVTQLTKDQTKTIIRRKQDGTPITVNGSIVNATGVTNVFGIKKLTYKINEFEIKKTQAFLLASDGFYSGLSNGYKDFMELLKASDLKREFELLAKKVFNQQNDDASAVFFRVIFEEDNTEILERVKIPELLLQNITTQRVEYINKYLNIIERDNIELSFSYYEKAIKLLMTLGINESEIYQRLVSLLKKSRR